LDCYNFEKLVRETVVGGYNTMEKNLKLAIIGNLMEQDWVLPFDIEMFFEEQLGQLYDGYAEYNYTPIPEVEAYLTGLELSSNQIVKLEKLVIDSDDDIYHCIWPQWDGEDDYFAFSSLDGLEQCDHLKMLDICGILSVEQPLDLTALTSLRAFESLRLDGGRLTDLHPLSEIHTLHRVKLTGTTIEPSVENQQIITMLTERGVKVKASL